MMYTSTARPVPKTVTRTFVREEIHHPRFTMTTSTEGTKHQPTQTPHIEDMYTSTARTGNVQEGIQYPSLTMTNDDSSSPPTVRTPRIPFNIRRKMTSRVRTGATDNGRIDNGKEENSLSPIKGEIRLRKWKMKSEYWRKRKHLVHTVVPSTIELQQSTSCEANDDTSTRAIYLTTSNHDANERGIDSQIIGMTIVIPPSDNEELPPPIRNETTGTKSPKQTIERDDPPCQPPGQYVTDEDNNKSTFVPRIAQNELTPAYDRKMDDDVTSSSQTRKSEDNDGEDHVATIGDKEKVFTSRTERNSKINHALPPITYSITTLDRSSNSNTTRERIYHTRTTYDAKKSNTIETGKEKYCMINESNGGNEDDFPLQRRIANYQTSSFTLGNEWPTPQPPPQPPPNRNEISMDLSYKKYMKSLQLLDYDGASDITTIVRKIIYDYIIPAVINNENSKRRDRQIVMSNIIERITEERYEGPRNNIVWKSTILHVINGDDVKDNEYQCDITKDDNADTTTDSTLTTDNCYLHQEIDGKAIHLRNGNASISSYYKSEDTMYHDTPITESGANDTYLIHAPTSAICVTQSNSSYLIKRIQSSLDIYHVVIDSEKPSNNHTMDANITFTSRNTASIYLIHHRKLYSRNNTLLFEQTKQSSTTTTYLDTLQPPHPVFNTRNSITITMDIHSISYKDIKKTPTIHYDGHTVKCACDLNATHHCNDLIFNTDISDIYHATPIIPRDAQQDQCSGRTIDDITITASNYTFSIRKKKTTTNFDHMARHLSDNYVYCNMNNTTMHNARYNYHAHNTDNNKTHDWTSMPPIRVLANSNTTTIHHNGMVYTFNNFLDLNKWDKGSIGSLDDDNAPSYRAIPYLNANIHHGTIAHYSEYNKVPLPIEVNIKDTHVNSTIIIGDIKCDTNNHTEEEEDNEFKIAPQLDRDAPKIRIPNGQKSTTVLPNRLDTGTTHSASHYGNTVDDSGLKYNESNAILTVTGFKKSNITSDFPTPQNLYVNIPPIVKVSPVNNNCFKLLQHPTPHSSPLQHKGDKVTNAHNTIIDVSPKGLRFTSTQKCKHMRIVALDISSQSTQIGLNNSLNADTKFNTFTTQDSSANSSNRNRYQID